MHFAVTTWAPTSFMNKFKPLSERTITTGRQWFTRSQESAPSSVQPQQPLISRMHGAPHAPVSAREEEHWKTWHCSNTGTRAQSLFVYCQDHSILYSKLFDFQCLGRICTNCKRHFTDECVIKRNISFFISIQKTTCLRWIFTDKITTVYWMSTKRTPCTEFRAESKRQVEWVPGAGGEETANGHEASC